MKTEQKIEIQANRLLGEFIGTVSAILHWDIPDELKVKLQAQLEELSKVKIISSNGDVSGNEANQPENKKDGEVAVAFADWIWDTKWFPKNEKGLWWMDVTTKQLYEMFENEKAKATDR